MSGLTREERAQLTDDDFADPSNRTLVILDSEDVRRAVFRSNVMPEPARTTIRRRIVEVALKKKLRIPPSLAIEEIRREVGDYHARQQGAGVSPGAGASSLRFEVRNEAELSRACETARGELEARGMTNFQNRHDTDAGRMTLQRIHDEAARAGAVCAAPKHLSASSEFVSAHEGMKIQAIHDLAVEGGAKCAERGSAPYFSAAEPPARRDPRERAQEYVEKRNRQIRGARGDAGQAELSSEPPQPSADPRERARAAARRHVTRRNEQIKRERETPLAGPKPRW